MEFEVTVKATSKEAFAKAFALFEEDRYKCIGYKIEGGKLYLSKYNDECTKLPYALNLQQTIDFAWGWLENNRLDSMTAPDTDGSTGQAFEVTNKELEWGGSYGWICTVEPIWFIYGK